MSYPQGSAWRRRGAVAVYVTLMFTLLLSVVAIGTDGGLLLTERRRAQAAADAAALAAAADLYAGKSTTTASATALSLAQANGYDNNGTTNIVEVNQPPKSGSFSGKTGYVEIVVTSYQKRAFSAIFGSGNLSVSARAVARGVKLSAGSGSTQVLPGGILLLASTGTALSVSGNSELELQANAGKVVVNSADSAAIMMSGSPEVSAPEIEVVGGISGGTLSNVNPNGVPAPTPDPLSTLQPPDLQSLNVQRKSQLVIDSKLTVTLNPGIYMGGISIIGSGNVILKPGIYFIEGGGLVDSGRGDLTGNGVMIYNGPGPNGGTTGSLSITGDGNLTLTPPTSGPYQGITIFQDRSSSAPISIWGNGDKTINGVFYAPAAQMTISGNGDLTNNTKTTVGSQYILNSLAITGNGQFALENANGSTGTVTVPGGTVNKFGLVE